ncbi:hypothetical protein NDU88_005997 [Pleurodeles waltl]|uniref:Uncharacterized protein n=1 Tax=Pleurodeles waltl TaxID=8319 RepID=A0AAV7X0D0_PLEWA|nr:hypothetical protein NDU88_005997 [Pleurodeles waltl]
MGKVDKSQLKLQFKLQKTLWPCEEGAAAPELGPNASGSELVGELHQILNALQLSLTRIDGKIDTFPYRMDRMPESIDKHAQRLVMVEQRVSEPEDEKVTTLEAQKQLEEMLTTLQARMRT